MVCVAAEPAGGVLLLMAHVWGTGMGSWGAEQIPRGLSVAKSTQISTFYESGSFFPGLFNK